MNAEDEAQLALELSQLASRLERGGDQSRDPGEDTRPERLLHSIGRLGSLARVSARLQAEAVRSAHEAGLSWARIGDHLGISRQAVQQRFDLNYHPQEPADETTRVLGPVSRAEELDHLNAAGAEGWRPVRSSPGQHVMRHAGGPWEVRRVSVFTAGAMPSEEEGWHAATTRFPDCFYIRALND